MLYKDLIDEQGPYVLNIWHYPGQGWTARIWKKEDANWRTSDASSKGLGHGDTLKEAIKDVLSKFKESTFGQTNR